MRDQYAASLGLSDFFVAMMRVGLLVGILGLGAVALRAVIERRRAIGVLRAVGYLRLQVLAGMLIETALIATAGLVVGLAVAIGLGGPLVTNLSPRSQFILDYGDIVATVQRLRANGVELLSMPENYYDDLEARTDLPAERLDVLRRHNILYDRDEAGEYFQAYTRAFEGLFQLGDLAAAAGQLGQHLGVALAGDEVVHDVPAGDPVQVGNDAGQLDRR